MSRDSSVEQVCDSKILYDTEWAAELATARVDFEARVYRCPGTNHYHIAHANREESIGHGHKLMECPKCHQLIKRKGASKHVRKCTPTLEQTYGNHRND